MDDSRKNSFKDRPPIDENLPGNKEYIKKFYKKSEKEIKEMTNKGDTHRQ